jgi:hypothetical protein
MKVVVAGSKLAMKDAVTGNDVYFVQDTTGKQFWSSEQLTAGVVVDIVERKKGDKYVDRKTGEEKVVQKDGYNLNLVLGSLSNVKQAILDAKELAELSAI